MTALYKIKGKKLNAYSMLYSTPRHALCGYTVSSKCKLIPHVSSHSPPLSSVRPVGGGLGLVGGTNHDQTLTQSTP